MPEFNFKLSDKELEDVIDFIYAEKAYMIHDERYPTPEAKKLLSKKEFFATDNSPKYYILRDDYIEAPFIFGSPGGDPKLGYFIYDQYGGPTILFSWNHRINSGDCYYYPYYYYETIDYYRKRPPTALVEFYKTLFKYIRKKGRIIRTRYHNRIYCGHEYLEQVLDGRITNIDDDFRQCIIEQTQ